MYHYGDRFPRLSPSKLLKIKIKINPATTALKSEKSESRIYTVYYLRCPVLNNNKKI